jgi:hypothetical protein
MGTDPAAKADKTARTALTLGLLSFCCTFITGVPAVALGLMARGKASPRGKTEATVAVVLGTLGIVLGCTSLVWTHFENRRIEVEKQAAAEAKQEEEQAARAALVASSESDMQSANEALVLVEQAVAARNAADARQRLGEVEKVLAPYREAHLTDEPTVAAVMGRLSPRAKLVELLEAYDGAQAHITAGEFMQADDALDAVQTGLGEVEPELASAVNVKGWLASVAGDRKKIAKKAKKQRDEAAEAAALAELCGDRPTPDAWDGGLIPVERFMKDNANDPDSIDVEACSMPVLTKNCWKTTCKVRGKNAFGAMVLNVNTFYIGRNPQMRSMGIVIGME